MAILTKFSISAPVKPGVILARVWVSISSAIRRGGTEVVGDFAGVVVEDLLTTSSMGDWHMDHVVDAARSDSSGVQGVGIVGGANDHDGFVLVEPVHLRQELVDGRPT